MPQTPTPVPETADPRLAHIKALLKTLPGKPGVYRMLDEQGTILYVGKARDLKKRVSSYFQKTALDTKTMSLVGQIHDIQIIVTHTETEALILENNLIKEYQPRYNILLRDDKSYPYIYLSSHQYPRFTLHRGAKKAKGRYFGPYPSASAARETLYLMQKLFPVRQCEDSVFNNRSRPCLQYQIKRCSGPCVGYVSEADYAEDVRHAVMMMEGKNNEVTDELVQRMETASEAQHYEDAARYRDQIAAIRRIQEKQYVSGDLGDTDIIAVETAENLACVQVFFIRGGRNLGNKSYFPKMTGDNSPGEVLAAFVPQFYLGKGEGALARDIPPSILLSAPLANDNCDVLTQTLSDLAGRKIQLQIPKRGDKLRWLDLARRNAHLALAERRASQGNLRRRYDALQEALALDASPERMECFDISHSHGEATVASCVVFGPEGPLKSDYRRFNIKGITAGDDYAAMNQALERRYRKLVEGEGKIPDILFIDGGKGQLSTAQAVLNELQVQGLLLVGIAKGEGRKPGLETLIIAPDNTQVHLDPDSPALHLIQQIRDEAHRFAITGHRQARGKARKRSVLEDIEGLGPKRRALLIKQFGGIQEIARAGVEDLARIPGISTALARKIYETFHEE